MAGRTGPRHIGVTEIGWRPRRCCVTGAAFGSRRDMGCRLSGRAVAIMTAGAGCTCIGVVKGCRRPAAGFVAVFTRIAGRQMVCRFAARRGAIVTAQAAARHATMVKAGRRPTCCGMAGATFLGRGDVRRWLSGGLNPVVAAGAAKSRSAMVKFGNLPAAGGMAAVAIRLGSHMVARHA